jgi:molecular chaperone GrpE
MGRTPSHEEKTGAPPDAEGPGRASRPEQAEADRLPPEDAALVSDLRDRLARARADYENLQRRVARDAEAERERNRARILEGFVPLLELAHMAAHQAEAHPGPMSEGMVMLAREFDRFVEREGLRRLGAVGDAVDPRLHDVVASEPADGVAPGCVSRVVQPGYLFGERVLRHAKVCVAPAPPA